jgi:RTX toxin transport system membrane fusion protein
VKGKVIEISPDSKKIGQGFYYEATISLDEEYVKKKGKKYKLFTGLTLLSEIVVERMRIIDNFLAPLRKL